MDAHASGNTLRTPAATAPTLSARALTLATSARFIRWTVATVGFPFIMTITDHVEFLLNGGERACLADRKAIVNEGISFFSCHRHGFFDSVTLALCAAFYVFMILPPTLVLRHWFLPHKWLRYPLQLFALLAVVPGKYLSLIWISIPDRLMFDSLVLTLCLAAAAIMPPREAAA